ncbi:serine/threonine-protein kinase [Nonomuraea gerenzanensis]|uniref:Uncharacterized protein n=1 Tax=Nonomuraea gerenzanensis TaxID=93944 RepID=A0A1M4ENA0_9ACTN|nr:hypothetical protein [Nonomuraea gerenzanensis]UBU11812.1 hypothetical protein LCN96_47175 [Nonomuraea gerenzanensis]SBP00317.1 hypothetical protein BN4615_P9833 [Nonomuraea gerenzanensis]
MLDHHLDALLQAATDRDPDRLFEHASQLYAATEHTDRATLSAVAARFGTVFDLVPPGIGARLGIVAGALAERGADPVPLGAPLVDQLVGLLEQSARFAAAWRSATGEAPPEPDDDDPAWVPSAAGRLTGLPEQEAFALADAWASLYMAQMPVLSILQLSPELRAALPSRERLVAALTAVIEDRGDLEWLAGLLSVLEGEHLIVLHRRERRGYEVVIGGIGDNFQLHTLLADVVSGPAEHGLIEGVQPEPEWVMGASDGDVDPEDGPVHGQFNLVDAYGKWIWNEGVPADIPQLDGVRVVVLDPPPYERSWSPGRRYPMMPGTIRLERILPADEAAAWLARIALESDSQ